MKTVAIESEINNKINNSQKVDYEREEVGGEGERLVISMSIE